MKEITCVKTVQDRVLERALELAEDIYWGEDVDGDKKWLDILIDFLDAEKVSDNDWDFICMVNGGETADYFDSLQYGEGKRIFREMRGVI